MNFWQIFFRVLPYRPLPAMSALWWHVVGRRLRARNRLRAAGADLPFAYNLWMRNVESVQHDRDAATSPKTWIWKPKFAVIVDAHGSDIEDLMRSADSVQNQTYTHWTLSFIGSEVESEPFRGSGAQVFESWGEALQGSIGEFIVPVCAGDQLSKLALFNFAEGLQAEPDAVVVYGDEDEIDASGRRKHPYFKPRWNKEMFLARNYIYPSCAIRATAVRANCSMMGSIPDVREMLLRVIGETALPVVHIPKIVTHRCNIDVQADAQSTVEAVGRHVASAGATIAPGPFGSVKVCWPLPAELPLVSIIVPTKDKLELLRPCIESLLTRTSYSPIEVIVVDNGSIEKQTLRYLRILEENQSVRVLTYPGVYNYSAINNYAARHARGSFICLLNNDTEVLDAEWLTEMVRYAVRPDIGAVGAKLLYADGTIQHAGVIVGIGDAAGHPHRNLPSNQAGYFCHAHIPQYVSAVTGACLLVDKRKYLAVGGLDEESLPIAYNDVDLCLKLERTGWRNVYVPHAVLTHHESKSRAKDHSRVRIDAYKRELKTFQDRWGARSYDDPLFNPNFDRSSETFVIRF